MTEPAALDRFLWNDPRDVGCAEALALLDLYIELVLANPGDAAARLRYAGVAAHLLVCGPCHDDYQGLLIAGVPTGGSQGRYRSSTAATRTHQENV